MAQYLKPDSELGYIEDTAEIEKLKINNLRHAILGCMLGDFNEVGAYIVSPEIVKELISMEKYIVQSYENIELCKSTLKLDKQIAFMVTFEGNKATLSLIEKLNYEANFLLNSGTYSNINEYILDSVETSGEVNRNVLYQRWNIKTNPGSIIDIFNCDPSVLEKYFGIVNRFKYLLAANKVLLEKENNIEEVEAGYTNEVLEILAHYPKLKSAVMATIKQNLKEKKDSLSVQKPYFAKTFNEVLENAIQHNLNLLDEKEKQDFDLEKRNSVVNLNVKTNDILEIKQIEDEDETNIGPKVIQLKTQPLFENKSIEEVAQDFVSEYRKVTGRLSDINLENWSDQNDLFRRTIVAVGGKKGNNIEFPNATKPTRVDTGEKNKLIGDLVEAGLGALINNPIKEEKIVEENVSVVTAPSKDQTSAKKAAAAGKDNGVKKSAPASKGGNSSSAKKPAAKKPADANNVKSGGGNTNTTESFKFNTYGVDYLAMSDFGNSGVTKSRPEEKQLFTLLSSDEVNAAILATNIANRTNASVNNRIGVNAQVGTSTNLRQINVNPTSSGTLIDEDSLIK